MNKCKNCQNQFEANYCNVCGQKYIDTKITLKSTLLQVTGFIFNVDKGLWHTTYLALANPKKLINEYLGGRTLAYFAPFRYVFVWTTVQIFLYITGGGTNDTMASYSAETEGMMIESSIMEQLITKVFNYFTFIFLATLPFFSLANYILFKRPKYNFAEHLVIAAYAFGTISFLGTIVSLFNFILPLDADIMQYIAGIVLLAYSVYITIRVFEGNVILKILKIIPSLFIWLIGFTFAFAVLTGILITTDEGIQESLKNSKKEAKELLEKQTESGAEKINNLDTFQDSTQLND